MMQDVEEEIKKEPDAVEQIPDFNVDDEPVWEEKTKVKKPKNSSPKDKPKKIEQVKMAD